MFGPLGFWTIALLYYAAKFDLFLSLDCARVEGVGAQGPSGNLGNSARFIHSSCRRLGDEMRSMSMEKSRQREAELLSEIEKLQGDIKLIQRSSEEGANVSQKLCKEVGGTDLL